MTKDMAMASKLRPVMITLGFCLDPNAGVRHVVRCASGTQILQHASETHVVHTACV